MLLGDRICCSYLEIAVLGRRGVDVVLHKHQSRRTDFRTGRRLGRHDHVITWSKPTRPEWMAPDTYAGLPPTLSVREVRVVVSCPGFRVRRYETITTLLDSRAVPAAELGALYRHRWEAELNLRSLKSEMGMDRLRCKSPAMVRKELWVHLLSYNLVRRVMAEAAGVAPGGVELRRDRATRAGVRAGVVDGRGRHRRLGPVVGRRGHTPGQDSTRARRAPGHKTAQEQPPHGQ